MISANRTGGFVVLHGKIKTTVYKDIEKEHVVPHLRTASNQPAVSIQDNIPCHTARSVQTFLSEEDISAIEWLAQCPNMNPIDTPLLFGSY